MSTLSPAEMMRQASMTAHDYMMQAIEDIDAQFGEGYAREHPELISGLVNAAATDYIGNRIADALEAVRLK